MGRSWELLNGLAGSGVLHRKACLPVSAHSLGAHTEGPRTKLKPTLDPLGFGIAVLHTDRKREEYIFVGVSPNSHVALLWSLSLGFDSYGYEVGPLQ